MDAAPVIAFSHANGFPARSYTLLFEHWREAGLRVVAVDKFGHDPAYPVSNNWPGLLRQLIHHVEREAPGAAVHFVGHSLGGFLSLMAACTRPDLAASLVMLDSPVVAGWRAHSLRVAKASGLMRRVSPGRISRRRRDHWPSADAVGQHFGAKAVFARWHPEALAHYVEHGTEPAEDGGRRLAFRREVEARIYDTLPHHVGPLLRRHPLRCPAAFIAGTRSAEVRQAGLQATRRLVGERLDWIAGTHLYPFEQPVETADRVLQAIAAMRPAGG